MNLTKESFLKLQEDKRLDLILIAYINESGYAGVDKQGHIVDRRFFPDAVPVQENSLMGIPAPKELPGETMLEISPKDVLQVVLKYIWTANGYSEELINEVFRSMNTIEVSDELANWVKLPDFNFLQGVFEHTNARWHYIFQEKEANDRLQKDIAAGVTFAFYEQDGKLCWER